MNYYNLSKNVLIFLSGAFASYIAGNFFRKKNERTKINEVIMFAYGISELKKSKISRCVITKSMDRLLYYLSRTRKSLDICMYIITNADIMATILKLHMRGVEIRVIMDADMAFANGAIYKRFEKQGVSVRWMKSTNLMHHKFCLMDTNTENVKNTPLVMMGSLNWTNQALNGNWEDVVVTSQHELVEKYKVEFERLWLQFKPIILNS